MDLIISAVEDVFVDVYEKGKYTKIQGEKVKAEDILKLVSDRCSGDFSKVDRIFLNMGPGSFTGIRASMALVVGLTVNKNIDIIPFTSFDALEYDILTAGKILAVTGFSNFVYVSYLKNKKIIQECIEYEKLVSLCGKSKTVITNSNMVKNMCDKLNISVNQVEFNLENIVLKFNCNKLPKINFEPIYLRLSQAELQRKENKK